MRIKTAKGSQPQQSRPAGDVSEALAVCVAETLTGWNPAARPLANDTQRADRLRLTTR